VEAPSTAQFVAGLVAGTIAALVVFAHADRRGNRHATAWGILSFFVPAALLVYFGRHWLRMRHR
jgi:hypothetical protein